MLNLSDESHLNPGNRLFTTFIDRGIHRGNGVKAGDIIVRMKKGKRPKLRLDLEFSLYANRMRAMVYKYSIILAQSKCSVKLTSQKYLY